MFFQQASPCKNIPGFICLAHVELLYYLGVHICTLTWVRSGVEGASGVTCFMCMWVREN